MKTKHEEYLFPSVSNPKRLNLLLLKTLRFLHERRNDELFLS